MLIRLGGMVLLAVSCGMVAINADAPVGTSPARKSEPVRVVVATVAIPRGQIIRQEDVKLIEWPRELAPQSAAARPEDVAGRAAAAGMMAGEPILEPKLAERHAGRGVEPLIPYGMRAFTIQAARVISGDNASFVVPGNKVDVLFKFRESQNDETQENKGTRITLLQAVEVLATSCGLRPETEDNRDGPSPTSMTLLVTPDQAAKLDLAQQMGQLIVSVCCPVDSEHELEPATLLNLKHRDHHG